MIKQETINKLFPTLFEKKKKARENTFKILETLALLEKATKYTIRQQSKVNHKSVSEKIDKFCEEGYVTIVKEEPFKKTGMIKKTYALTVKGLIAILSRKKVFGKLTTILNNLKKIKETFVPKHFTESEFLEGVQYLIIQNEQVGMVIESLSPKRIMSMITVKEEFREEDGRLKITLPKEYIKSPVSTKYIPNRVGYFEMKFEGEPFIPTVFYHFSKERGKELAKILNNPDAANQFKTILAGFLNLWKPEENYTGATDSCFFMYFPVPTGKRFRIIKIFKDIIEFENNIACMILTDEEIPIGLNIITECTQRKEGYCVEEDKPCPYKPVFKCPKIREEVEILKEETEKKLQEKQVLSST